VDLRIPLECTQTRWELGVGVGGVTQMRFGSKESIRLAHLKALPYGNLPKTHSRPHKTAVVRKMQMLTSHILFDIEGGLCYKTGISPLSLRE
jgi:hypothetical protein